MIPALITLTIMTFLAALREFFHYQECQAYIKERKDLYSRLMAKDLADYRQNSQPSKLPRPRNALRQTILKEREG